MISTEMATMDRSRNIYREQDLQEGPSRDMCNYSKERGYYPGPCMDCSEPCLCWSAEVLDNNIHNWTDMCKKSSRVSGFQTEFEELVDEKRKLLENSVQYNEMLHEEQEDFKTQQLFMALRIDREKDVTAMHRTLQTIGDWIETGKSMR
jgi:hypothetical protein